MASYCVQGNLRYLNEITVLKTSGGGLGMLGRSVGRVPTLEMYVMILSNHRISAD